MSCGATLPLIGRVGMRWIQGVCGGLRDESPSFAKARELSPPFTTSVPAEVRRPSRIISRRLSLAWTISWRLRCAMRASFSFQSGTVFLPFQRHTEERQYCFAAASGCAKRVQPGAGAGEGLAPRADPVFCFPARHGHRLRFFLRLVATTRLQLEAALSH